MIKVNRPSDGWQEKIDSFNRADAWSVTNDYLYVYSGSTLIGQYHPDAWLSVWVPAVATEEGK